MTHGEALNLSAMVGAERRRIAWIRHTQQPFGNRLSSELAMAQRGLERVEARLTRVMVEQEK